MGYLAKHMHGAKNLWQVAMVIGIALGAFISMTISRARRQIISPVWKRAVGIDTLAKRAPMAFAEVQSRWRLQTWQRRPP
jgi:hypothetical protein